MYARNDERSVFMNNTRHLVFLRVAENPGASIQDIASMLSISHPTAAYHLKILERNGLIVPMRDGNRARYFKRSEALSQDQQKLVAANRGERTKQILEIVARQPMIHRKELARLLSIPRTTVNWHVDRLVQMGLVAERRAGRYCQLFIPLNVKIPVEPLAQDAAFAPVFSSSPAPAAPVPEPHTPGWA
ncbi:MAG: winged helix-turn-helix transcriptional regulator [Halobacteriales archaeon]|nr:winged helix-turn-helix transcriptional regulator [Halobacteriales archaeon]